MQSNSWAEWQAALDMMLAAHLQCHAARSPPQPLAAQVSAPAFPLQLHRWQSQACPATPPPRPYRDTCSSSTYPQGNLSCRCSKQTVEAPFQCSSKLCMPAAEYGLECREAERCTVKRSALQHAASLEDIIAHTWTYHFASVPGISINPLPLTVTTSGLATTRGFPPRSAHV